MARYERGLLRYATRLLNSPATAQDVVQNAFIKLFKGWERGLGPSGELKNWLYRVTHNEAVDHIRRESRLRLLHEEYAAEADLACADGRHCAWNADDRREAVLLHVRKLRSAEQQVLLLRLDEGLSYKEIGAITGRSTGNVGKLLHEAVKKLSEILVKAGIVEGKNGSRGGTVPGREVIPAESATDGHTEGLKNPGTSLPREPTIAAQCEAREDKPQHKRRLVIEP